jgi:hypothetical protein
MPGSTPIYGFPYPDPSDLVANYPALGQQLAEDVEDEIVGAGGLKLISSVTFAAASAVSMNNVFTSDFTNYRIVFHIFGGTNASTMTMRLRAAGTDATSNVYKWSYLGYNNVAGNEAGQNTGTSSWTVLTDQGNDSSFGAYDIMGPQVASTTQIIGSGTRLNASNNIGYLTLGGAHSANTSYDGFTLLAATGTIQAIVNVYGYRKP